MKLWATRDGVDDLVFLWEGRGKRPHRDATADGLWVGGSLAGSLPGMVFKSLFGRLPRRNSLMRVTLTGRVTK